MTSSPVWFGPHDRPLFGWFHVPENGARGAVVLCPPIGWGYVGSHHSYRVLANRLEDAGYAVLRFDYDGTGDSTGAMLDADRVDAWHRSVDEAVSFVRSAGAKDVTVVGMRLGATLAALAAERSEGFDALVLWDPCRSGTTFLREERALRMMNDAVDAEPQTSDGSVEALAWVYDAQTATDLKAVDITKTEGPLARRCLVLTRSDRAPDEQLKARLDMPHITWAEAVGQAALVDEDPQHATVPTELIDTIVSFVAQDASDGSPITTVNQTSALVSREVRETAVVMNDRGLFGIVTQPTTTKTGRTALLLNIGADHHIGPARLWVELARSWAASGIRTVRFDFSGIGESPARPGQPGRLLYSPTATEDVLDVARSFPGPIVLIGVCSGAFAAIDAGALLDATTTKIGAVDPVMDRRVSPFFTGMPQHGRVIGLVQRTLSPRALQRVQLFRQRARTIRSRILDGAHLNALPERRIKRLARRGMNVLLVLDSRTDHYAKRFMPSESLEVLTPADLDHSLLARGPRDEVVAALTRFVRDEKTPDTQARPERFITAGPR